MRARVRLLFFCTVPALLSAGCATGLTGVATNAVPALIVTPEVLNASSGFVKQGRSLWLQRVTLQADAKLTEAAVVTGSRNNVTVNPGSILFSAAFEGRQIRCSGVSETADPSAQYQHFNRDFFCFDDQDGDGKFDRYFVTVGPLPGYPTFGEDRSTWRDLAPVAYQRDPAIRFPTSFIAGVMLRSVDPDDNEVSLEFLVAPELPGKNVPHLMPAGHHFRPDASGLVNVQGAQVRLTGLTKDGANVELVKPMDSQLFAVRYRAARSVYVAY